MSCFRLLHPTQMLCGTLAVGAAGGFFYFLTSNQQGALSFKKSHPLLFMISLFAVAGFVVYLLGSIATFLLGILLPILVIFVHASMRLRNLRNKVLNKLEWTGLRRSPMGVLLETIGWEQEINMEMKKTIEERAKFLWSESTK
ncbi:Prenylated rab acceptor PRA1 [Trinorchestia longiramus]|nr:Prenylated rab acceptor PRA1 [Trinorchestia longiramus]